MFFTQRAPSNPRDIQMDNSTPHIRGIDYFDTCTSGFLDYSYNSANFIRFWDWIPNKLTILVLSYMPHHIGCLFCMSRSFAKEGKVLKLKRSHFLLWQSARNFFEHLRINLVKVGFNLLIRSGYLSLHFRKSDMFDLCGWHSLFQPKCRST